MKQELISAIGVKIWGEGCAGYGYYSCTTAQMYLVSQRPQNIQRTDTAVVVLCDVGIEIAFLPLLVRHPDAGIGA